MDDLDHSVHIAERDWDSFYKESEECSLPQPELAGSDDLGLSDEEPEDSVCPVFPALGNVQDDPRQQNAAPNTAIPSEPSVKEEATLREDFICTDLPVKICESGSEETQLNDPLSLTEEEGGALLDSFFDNSPHAQKESDSGYYGENRGSGYFEENSLTTELVKDTPGETAEQNTEETSRNQNITKNLGSGPESSSNKCIANSDPSGACDVSDIKGFDGELPSEGGTGTLHDILTPLSLQPVPLPHQDLYPGQNISQEQLLCHTETAILCERHAIVAPREEKERWFVTVNESQAPHRVHAATAVKKKRRKKKTCRNSVPRGHHTSEGPDPPPESESEIDIDRMEESNRQETMNEFSTQSCNKSKPLPDTHTLPNNYHREVYIEFPKINVSYSELPPLFSELSSSSSISEDVNISTESPLQRDDSTEALDPESSIEENKQENYSSAVGLKRSVDHPLSKLQHLLLALHRSESVYSNEEGELFYTTSTSYDSEEEYVSATEMEDTNIPSSEIDSTLSASLPLQTPTANSQPLIQEDCLNCPLLSQREGYENTADQAYIESVRTCPSTGHSNSNPIMSEESSVPADSKHSPDSHMTNETPAHRAGEPLTVWEHLPQTNTSEDQPPLPLPEVTVTPTENPETSYNASDPTRPVYAISAFWDEMEKLTIKDILHLRVCRSPSPPKETLHPQESDSARVDVTVTDADMLNSSLTDIEEYYSQDSSLMDTSDTADSDYFTHNDDSPKPDRSSCEFSTFSDFDEEYMPFFGTSSIPSPDISNTSLLPEATCLKGIRKSRSMLNIVQDLEVAQVETQLKDMHNAQALDVEKQLKDMLIDRISRMPSPILPNTDILDERYRITFPELYEYLFTEDVLSVYESLLSTSVAECCYDYSLSEYGAGVLFPPLVQQSLHGEGEPVHIFSCSLVTRSDIQAKEAVSFSSQRGWTGNWKSLLSLRRNRFPGMGSTSSSWCWRSGAWMSPAVGQTSFSTTINHTTHFPWENGKDGILFSLKQSDMCLVCIAFASWVLRSADPMAADTWKAALLANVSAISAIQYLRRYVVKRREAGDLNDSTEDKA
uniref:PGC-1 and ERR-induced regulator in muscle protein 1 n=1 Tax=Oncorhynchus kisutch TaxID=8019 RepID=A0A8C7HTU1_ONCKI